MSGSELPTDGNGASPSPGKGGKFLELMQKRILAEQQQVQQPSSGIGTEPNAQADFPQNEPITGSAVLQQPPSIADAPIGAADSSTEKHLPISRPKGKDFATMSSRGPIPSILSQPQPPQQPPQMQIQPPQLQQQQISTSAPPAGKSKGKDFSAMASRMAVPIPAPVPAPAPLHSQPMIQNPIANDQAAQVARAAQMQAEARAAAGLPPLNKPSKCL